MSEAAKSNLCIKGKNKNKEKFEEIVIFPLVAGKGYSWLEMVGMTMILINN